MPALFFYGTLRHLPLLEVVAGRESVQAEEAILPDHAVHWVKDQPFPIMVQAPGRVAQGLWCPDLTEEDLARLDFYEGGFGYGLVPVTVQVRGRDQSALVYLPDPDRWPLGADWSLDDWVRDWGEMSVIAAGEAMARFGEISARDLVGLLPAYRARAWANLMAREMAPTDLRDQDADALMSRRSTLGSTRRRRRGAVHPPGRLSRLFPALGL